MEVSISSQLTAFLAMLLGGAVSGLVSDIFYCLRPKGKKRRITAGFSDLLLWTLIAVGIFILNFIFDDGSLRWYTVLGLLLGATLYFLTLSPIMRFVFGWVFDKIEKILRLILKIVLTILAFLYKIIYRVFCFCARPLLPLKKKVCRCGKRTKEDIKRFFFQTWLVLKKK